MRFVDITLDVFLKAASVPCNPVYRAIKMWTKVTIITNVRCRIRIDTCVFETIYGQPILLFTYTVYCILYTVVIFLPNNAADTTYSWKQIS